MHWRLYYFQEYSPNLQMLWLMMHSTDYTLWRHHYKIQRNHFLVLWIVLVEKYWWRQISIQKNEDNWKFLNRAGESNHENHERSRQCPEDMPLWLNQQLVGLNYNNVISESPLQLRELNEQELLFINYPWTTQMILTRKKMILIRLSKMTRVI